LPDENAEIVRKAIAAFNESGVDGLIAYSAEDIVTYAIPEWLEDDLYPGHDGLRRVFAWQDAFDRVVWETLEMRDIGSRVLVRARVVGETRSGGELQQEFAAMCARISAGRVGELRMFRTWAEALEAAEANA
jgi:hypothetical protein